MINNESRIVRRIRILWKKRIIIAMLLLVVAYCSAHFFGSKYYYNKNINIGTNVNSKGNTSIDAAGKPSLPTNDTKANIRESTVNDNTPTTDASKGNLYAPNGTKVAYLTFDDGPSANNTPKVLEILDKYNIKATFFIIGSMAAKHPDLVKSEFERGHAIANHTYSHEYKYIYSNTAEFIADVNKCDTTLKSILGDQFSGKLVRFPGGSSGKKLAPFRESIQNAGYHYIDWNDLTGDAEGNDIPVDKLLSNLKMYTANKEHVVILMHDAPDKETTAQALPQVIEYLKSQGYSFAKLK